MKTYTPQQLMKMRLAGEVPDFGLVVTNEEKIALAKMLIQGGLVSKLDDDHQSHPGDEMVAYQVNFRFLQSDFMFGDHTPGQIIWTEGSRCYIANSMFSGYSGLTW